MCSDLGRAPSLRDTRPMTIHITGDDSADQVLSNDPFALLVGMMLDQQYPMEHAFRGPAKVLERFGTLDPSAIATADPGAVRGAVLDPAGGAPLPGLDGGPDAGARRTGRGEVRRRRRRPLGGVASGKELLGRVMELPGFGKQKAQIFVALLAKQLGVRPEGWEAAVGAYAEEGYRSVADVVDGASLQKVRDYKKQKKAAAKAQAV